MSAAMPRGNNHAKTDAAGSSSILRALLERTSSDDIHSRKKNEEALDLKKKEKLKEINSQKKKENNKINNNNDKEKWKNIMTMIHRPAIRNMNLTCGGNCILRRGTDESKISSGETIPMHSGTDSQYERANPDASPERRKEIVTPSEKVIIDISNEDNPTKQLAERYMKFLPEKVHTYPEENPKGYPQQEHNYPKEYPKNYPEEYLKDNLNFTPEQPDENNDTYTRKKDHQEAKNPEETAGRTCKRNKINKTHVKTKIKIKTKLIFYRKLKSKL